MLLPLIATLLFLVLPLAALVDRSVSDQGIGAAFDLLGDDLFVDALKRTLLLSLIVTFGCCVIGVPYTLAMVGARRSVGFVLLLILLSTFWISILVRTFGWVLLLQPAGALEQVLHKFGLVSGSLDLFQTTPAMYPAMVHVMLPFFILPVYASCLRLDTDLLRAGQSLGAKPLSVLRHVVLPHLRPAILAGASIVFMLSLGFFVTPLLLGGPDNLTVATLINRQFSELYDLGTAATMALFLLIVVLVLYLVIDRFVPLVQSGAPDT
ncbi:MAG TPA: ABC transporter permease [Thermoleophilaceae bacterium]|nr:ABC transporter permease [Thermoleophilaceae bacterium]